MIPLLLLLALAGLMHAARTFSEAATTPGTQLAFGYLLLAAFLTAKLVSRIGLPKLTGYLIAGIVSGPYVLELVSASMTVTLKVVSNTAVAIIALEAGADLELAKVRRMAAALGAITCFAIIGAMLALAGAVFAMRPLLPIFDGMTLEQTLAVCGVIGVALSAQSPAVVMALLAETRAEGPLSSMILAAVVVADLVVIICFSIASAIAGSLIGGGFDASSTALAVSWELFGSMVFGCAIGALIGAFLRAVKDGGTLFALTVCVVVAEVGARVHLDPLIVMLAAGVWLRNFSRADSRSLMHSFESAQLPVFLVFFALAGSKIDVYTLWYLIVPIAILASTRAAWFFLGTRVACALTETPDVVRRYAWFGLVPQAGLALALALVLAKNFPGWGEQCAVILFGVVAFNELVAPPILRQMLLRSGEVGRRDHTDFATSSSRLPAPP